MAEFPGSTLEMQAFKACISFSVPNKPRPVLPAFRGLFRALLCSGVFICFRVRTQAKWAAARPAPA